MSNCNTCDRLREIIADLRKEVKEERSAKDSAEAEARSLKPYKEAADRSYDRIVTIGRIYTPDPLPIDESEEEL